MDAGYQLIQFPLSRLATIDVGRYSSRRHVITSLVEVDVTEARRQARRMRRQGASASFTAWMIKTIADCVAANPQAHALRKGRRGLVLFHDVDVAMPVERMVDGTAVPLAFKIEAANRKSVFDIGAEIETAQGRGVADERDYTLSEHGIPPAVLRLYYRLPSSLRVLAFRWLLANPFRARRASGTVMVTTVNATGSAAGWLLATRSLHNLSIGLGSVSRKPWVVNGRVEPRDILHLAVTFDHDVIDGVPARKFLSALVARIQAPSLAGAAAGP